MGLGERREGPSHREKTPELRGRAGRGGRATGERRARGSARARQTQGGREGHGEGGQGDTGRLKITKLAIWDESQTMERVHESVAR